MPPSRVPFSLYSFKCYPQNHALLGGQVDLAWRYNKWLATVCCNQIAINTILQKISNWRAWERNLNQLNWWTLFKGIKRLMFRIGCINF